MGGGGLGIFKYSISITADVSEVSEPTKKSTQTSRTNKKRPCNVNKELRSIYWLRVHVLLMLHLETMIILLVCKVWAQRCLHFCFIFVFVLFFCMCFDTCVNFAA